MNRNFKRAECSAKSFFCACMLLKLKKINFITVKDQLNEAGVVESLTLYQGGKEMPAKKLK